jgi:RES domain-containing protein
LRLTGLVYRAHNPRWSFAPVSGDGAARYGGRFNPIGTPALYTSRRMETAWFEAQQGFAFKAQPLTICAYEVDCRDIVDLAEEKSRRELGVTAADLACAWEDLVSRGERPPGWRLAERLIASGVAGIIVPSFAPGAGAADRNVVFWRWADIPPNKVAVIDDEARLPRPPMQAPRDSAAFSGRFYQPSSL